ncbi:hypothetical protein NZD88_13220 [Chryseobacterium antibioticum]|uniref:Uncharacterized protein n=1 Tax=Chryseobacterium pyrolae TaxID=2987481 RepID=A0ABT2IIM2_9FLAO|nr:hypothetical protein [Chryseobacterium pyrolae]MCT2408505.1 hypothetical protein [Chryseobacterium pyrolae]
MKKNNFLMLFILALLSGCREELDYMNNENSKQNPHAFTKDNIITKQLFKSDYESSFSLKQNIEGVNVFLKQESPPTSGSSLKNSIIEGIEVYTDVFEEVDYLNVKYYSFYIVGTSRNDYEQKLVLKYVNNQISERHIIKYKRLPNLQIDPNSYQLEKLIQNTSGSSNSKIMYIDTFSVGCTTYMVTTFNCGHQGNHSNGQFCDVEQTYMPQDIIASYNNPNCNVGGGLNTGYTPGGNEGSPGGVSGGGGDPGIPSTSTPAVITIPTVAPIYSIKGIKTGTIKNPPDFNPLGLNNTEITQINSNDQFRLKIYQFFAIEHLYPFDSFLSDEQQTFVKALLKYIQDNPNVQINDLNHEFLNSVYKFLQEEYGDINVPLEIFHRFKALDDAITQNPNLLLDIPCTELPKWQELATHPIPQSVKNKIFQVNGNTGWFSSAVIQNLDYSNSFTINMDVYPVKISNMPEKSPGVKYTPAEFFDYFRKNINNFTDINHGMFYPVVESQYGIDDTQLWNSTNPIGALITIKIPPDNGTVVCSGFGSQAWIFTTVKSPWDGEHPVSGNRLFGYSVDASGDMIIYTRGVDRFTTKVSNNALQYTVESFGYSKAQEMWTTMQQKVSSFVNSKNGSSSIIPSTDYTPNYIFVKDYLRGNKPITALGCH